MSTEFSYAYLQNTYAELISALLSLSPLANYLWVLALYIIYYIKCIECPL